MIGHSTVNFNIEGDLALLVAWNIGMLYPAIVGSATLIEFHWMMSGTEKLMW